MSKETGEWLPYNLNNGPHECKSKNDLKEFKNEAKLATETLTVNRVMLQEIIDKLGALLATLNQIVKK